MKWAELIKDTAWVVEDLLTQEECLYFLEKAKEADIYNKRAEGDVRHRAMVSVPIHDQNMAERVWERIKNHIPQEITIDDKTNNKGIQVHVKDLIGTWKPCGINARWRVARYDTKGHFGPHRDACYVVDEHHRSLITINGYLKDRPLGYGGATRFVDDEMDVYKQQTDDGRGEIFTTPEQAVIHKVEADKAGKAVVFFHDLMHDGEPIKEGSPVAKWIFRSEIMFERDVTTAPKLSLEEIQAKETLKQAEEAEAKGDISKAIKLYSQAYRYFENKEP